MWEAERERVLEENSFRGLEDWQEGELKSHEKGSKNSKEDAMRWEKDWIVKDAEKRDWRWLALDIKGLKEREA